MSCGCRAVLEAGGKSHAVLGPGVRVEPQGAGIRLHL